MEIGNKIMDCSCGRLHEAGLDTYVAEKGAVSRVPEFVRQYGASKAFLLADRDTYAAAGEQVARVLEKAGIPFTAYILPDRMPKPDEHTLGAVMMHYDSTCDILIGVGSGVIHDLGKVVAHISGKPYIIVATAPSMDGYASKTSSMERDGLKTSLPTTCANVVIGDIDILKKAPKRMLISGLGDMLAKYVSLCEWRISHLVTGEYYCETVAQLVRDAVKKCTDNAAGLLKREDAAVQAVFEGLIIGGVAMNYAGLSRPASGVEHYFSHVWDMRGLEFGTPVDFHGIQCAIGTRYAVGIYHRLKHMVPDREKALEAVRNFDREAYFRELQAFLGKGAEVMIAQEAREGKYDPDKHSSRLEVILGNWEQILQIMEEELPEPEQLDAILDMIEAPKTLEEIGLDAAILPMTFRATRDIRDKYVLSRLCWDLGVTEALGW